MKKQELLDIYSDYLMSAFGQTTGTGLAGLLGNSVSHDQVQRLLAQDRLGSAELWQMVKPYVRQIQEEDGVMILSSLCRFMRLHQARMVAEIDQTQSLRA